MKKTPMFLFAVAFCNVCAMAQVNEKTVNVLVENNWNREKKNEPVVLNLKDIKTGFNVKSVTVWDGEKEIASQIDDLDRDCVMDEVAFVADIPAKAKKQFRVVLSDRKSDKTYPAKVHAQMRLNDKSKKNPFIQSMTVPGTTPAKQIYSAMYHHGPAFESELIALRIYFDNRQSVDIYGKKYQRLELEETNFYTTKEQKKAGYGNDILWAGTSVGLGSFRGWENEQPQYVENVETRGASVLASGPVRAIIEFKDRNWKYQGTELNMIQRYYIYAGHRDVQVKVDFKEDYVKNNTFCTGVQKLERDNVGFLENDGLAGSWGTNLPEKGDTISTPREMLGLGIWMPKENVEKVKEDENNYLIIMDTNGKRELGYYFTFVSAKEEKGIKNSKEWFEFLKEWRKELEHPCKVTIE